MRRLLVILALVIGLGTASANPAQAYPTDCPGTFFCLYDNVGNPYDQAAGFSASITRNVCYSATQAGIVSYRMNNTGVRWYLFRAAGCGGSHIEAPANMYGPITDLTGASGWNDQVTHVMRTSTPY